MSTPETYDIAALITEASESPPVGPNLKEDADYYELKSARRSAQRAESRLRDAWEKDGLEEPDWRPLWKGAREFLKRSKDLWVTTWLAEAALRLNGFASLRDTFRLIRELVDRYWDVGLQPQPEEGDSAGNSGIVSQLAGLNESLIIPIKEVPITGAGYSTLDYETAREIEEDSEENRLRRIEEGAVAMSDFQKAVSATDADFFTNLYEDIVECIDELKKMSAVLNERCGEENGYSIAPSFSNVEETLDDCKRTLINIAPHVETVAEGEADESSEAGEDQLGAVGTGGNVRGSKGAVGTRQEAFLLLERVASFFEQTEPHSPVSYALRKAVRWGKMPLDKWLKEMLNEDSRSEMFRMIGIDQDPSESEEE